jgi:transposase InsO family protein
MKYNCYHQFGPSQGGEIDIVAQLPTAPDNYKYAIVALEYFSKSIEVVQGITSQIIQKFFWQSIICRFGVPYEVTVDNGKQFDSIDFRRFCFNLGTKLCFASVYHPEFNGAVERAKGIIFTGSKKNLT